MNLIHGSVATLEMQVRERLGLPDWKTRRWELLGGDNPSNQVSRLDGGVYPPKTRGKNQGEPNWRRPQAGTAQTIYITPMEHSEWLKGWEARTLAQPKALKLGLRGRRP